MILNLLKENKINLNEEIDLNNPTVKTTNFKIYELTDRNDFSSFTINGENSVADHFGFSQNNWQQYVGQGQVKPFVITNTDSNECIAMMLLWSNNLYNFDIRENKTISLPISFESVSNNGNSAYANFVSEHENNVLPLYTLLVNYQDFTGYNLNEYIRDGQYIKDGKLKGIFKEFFTLNGDGTFNYPNEINLNQLNLRKLEANSIVYDYFGDDMYTIHVNFYDNLEEIAENAIVDQPGDLLWYCGDQDTLPEVFNSLPQSVRDDIELSDNEEVQQRRYMARAERERMEAETQEAEDRQEASSFDDAVNNIYSRILPDEGDDEYNQYDPQYDGELTTLKMNYDTQLSDHQKELVTTYDKLQAAINKQNQLKAEYIDKQNHEEADNFITSVVAVTNKIHDGIYTTNSQVDSALNSLKNEYNNNLSDEVKNIINTEYFNFNEKIDELVQRVQQQREEKRQRWLNSHQNVDPNITLYDNWLFVKFLPNGEASVIGYKKRGIGNVDTMTIPDEVDGHKVTRIEKNAFLNLDAIDFINVPVTVKYIGPDAFHNGPKPRFSRDVARNAQNAKKVKIGKNALGHANDRAGSLYGKSVNTWRDQNNDN